MNKFRFMLVHRCNLNLIIESSGKQIITSNTSDIEEYVKQSQNILIIGFQDGYNCLLALTTNQHSKVYCMNSEENYVIHCTKYLQYKFPNRFFLNEKPERVDLLIVDDVNLFDINIKGTIVLFNLSTLDSRQEWIRLLNQNVVNQGRVGMYGMGRFNL